MFGENKKTFDTEFFYVTDKESKTENLKITWYSYNKSPTNTDKQYFLYYQKKPVIRENMREGDLMLLGKLKDGNLVLVVIQKNSKQVKKVLSLFNLQEKNNQFIFEQDELMPIIQETDSIHSDTSNLKEHKDIKIYQNTKTNKIVIVGKATQIKDGDTIVVSDLFNVRLYGIDTPEKKQLCKNKKDVEYNCGEMATDYLKKLVGNKTITCINNGNEKYGRFLFVCKTDKYNINQEMVKSGWALSYYNNEYKDEEGFAETNKFGIWQGEFEKPELWRKQQKNKSK